MSLARRLSAEFTGTGLLVLMFGPISGAHFNPVVSAVDWW